MNNKSKYSLYTALFLLLSIFVLFIFTKDLYFSYVDNSENEKNLEQKIQEKNDEYKKLGEIKTTLNSPKNKDLGIKKFLVSFREDELLDYFYSYANTNFGKVRIESLNLSEGKLNEFGLNEANIELVATFNTEQDMIDMMNFLLNSDKYNLYIHNFTYPLGTDFTAPFKVSIPMKVLYK